MGELRLAGVAEVAEMLDCDPEMVEELPASEALGRAGTPFPRPYVTLADHGPDLGPRRRRGVAVPPPSGVARGTGRKGTMKPAALAELELLRGSDVARRLGISRQAVHELHRRGRAPEPAITPPGGPLWSRETRRAVGPAAPAGQGTEERCRGGAVAESAAPARRRAGSARKRPG